jgi:hypothetical protein
MANEITLAIQIQQTKNGKSFTDSTGGLSITQTGNSVSSGVILALAASAVSLPLGDIASPGLALVRNLDATNYIELGYDDTGFVAVMKIPSGQAVLVSLDGIMAAPQVKANTANALTSFSIFAK